MEDPADVVDEFVYHGGNEVRVSPGIRYPDLTPRNEEPDRDDEENIRVNGVRMRRRNTTLDWQAIDYETRRNLRTARSGAKRGFTTALNRLSNALVAEGSAEEVTKLERKLEENFEKFKLACNKYQDLLVDDDDLDECVAYFRETESRFTTMKERVNLFLESNTQTHMQGNFPDVAPSDSASQVTPHETTSTRSSWTSRERSSNVRSSNAKLKAATKRASLMAEESLLEEKYRLEKMELELKREKKALQLKTEIAKVEAEERACIGFTWPNQTSEVKSIGFVTPPRPVKQSLQVWSERARSTLRLLGSHVRSSSQVPRTGHTTIEPERAGHARSEPDRTGHASFQPE